jgi:SAM-dependent methyltransferase
MLDPDVSSFVLGSLPAAPARVLEVGAGGGELARAMSAAGYEVVAIDPASTVEHVRPIPLLELAEPAAGFDAAVAVVSLHHVEPLRESYRRLAEAVRPGGALVLDEIDVERFDERAARWWLDERGPSDHGPRTPGDIVGTLRHHIHDLPTMRQVLDRWFELGPPTRGPYLYRWELGPDRRGPEEELIAAGRLPAVGVRLLGTRRPGPA